MGQDDLQNAQLDAIVDHMQEAHWSWFFIHANAIHLDCYCINWTVYLSIELYLAIRNSETPSELFKRGGNIPAPDKTEVGTFEAETLPFYLQKFNAMAAQGFFYGSQVCYNFWFIDTGIILYSIFLINSFF